MPESARSLDPETFLFLTAYADLALPEERRELVRQRVLTFRAAIDRLGALDLRGVEPAATFAPEEPGDDRP